jgi:hypothetical protein
VRPFFSTLGLGGWGTALSQLDCPLTAQLPFQLSSLSQLVCPLTAMLPSQLNCPFAAHTALPWLNLPSRFTALPQLNCPPPSRLPSHSTALSPLNCPLTLLPSHSSTALSLNCPLTAQLSSHSAAALLQLNCPLTAHALSQLSLSCPLATHGGGFVSGGYVKGGGCGRRLKMWVRARTSMALLSALRRAASDWRRVRRRNSGAMVFSFSCPTIVSSSSM